MEDMNKGTPLGWPKISNMRNSYGARKILVLGSKHYKNAKILNFGQYLDIAKCDQNFTT